VKKRPPHDHPLTEIALKAFEKGPQDAITLITVLSGYSPPPTTPLMNAYKRVAKDVIENLEARGLIYNGDASWYYLVKAEQKGAGK
jgi:hypothetical protein